MKVWRLARFIYRDLSGKGGCFNQGRWNEVELPIVYTSANLALSVLERRVHSVQQPKDDVSIEIEIPDDSIELLPPLPDGWKQNPDVTRRLGMDWLRTNRSLCLRVPSALVPEFNYLINPSHRDIGLVRIVAVTPFEYDPRLFQSQQAESFSYTKTS